MITHGDLKPAEELPFIRYAHSNTIFFKSLQKSVNEYFKTNKLDRFGGKKMYLKTAFLFSAWGGSYALLMSDQFAGLFLIFLQALFHFTMFLMTVGIAHDASHYAYSRRKSVNKWMTRVFDLVGINSYLWEFNHVKSHHNAPNIPVYDSAIDSFLLFRFHPRAAHHSFHRYQHIYMIVIYAFATLYKLFFLDFFSLGRKRIGFISIKQHPFREIVFFFFSRTFVILYTLVIPLVVLSAPSWQVVLGFTIGHILSGLSLGAIFQTTHLSDRTAFPEPDKSGKIENAFDQHILDTTADFCPDNPVVTWISGGLNLHVAHHLFPGISQIHLPAITKIVRQTAKEYDMNYKAYATLGEAVRSHLFTLRQLGDPRNLPDDPIEFFDPKIEVV